MFPAMCSRLPCMKIEVNIVSQVLGCDGAGPEIVAGPFGVFTTWP